MLLRKSTETGVSVLPGELLDSVNIFTALCGGENGPTAWKPELGGFISLLIEITPLNIWRFGRKRSSVSAGRLSAHAVFYGNQPEDFLPCVLRTIIICFLFSVYQVTICPQTSTYRSNIGFYKRSHILLYSIESTIN